MFHQQIAPIGGNLALSTLVAALPVAVVLVVLGVWRRPGWQAALAGLGVALLIAVGPWQMPAVLALDAVAFGATFALMPVIWIVVNALLVYNIAVRCGQFDALCRWLRRHLPDDRRVVLIVVGFCFSALFEGISGFGTPVAIAGSLLILAGFEPLDALVYVLIFNTAPVAYGALGTPVTVLGAVTGLPAVSLGAMVGRQLPVIALVLPFYVIALYGGWRSVRALWPMLLVTGGSFALLQFVASNFIDYTLTDVLSSLGSLLAALLFLRYWRPAPDPAHRLAPLSGNAGRDSLGASDMERGAGDARGWLPWLLLAAVVILWSSLKVPVLAQQKIAWPGLHRAIAITLYDARPYDAWWNLQPFGTGTAILVAAVLIAMIAGLSVLQFIDCVIHTLRQYWRAAITVMLIIGLAYLMNYAGLAYTLGKGVASTGSLFVLLSPFLGWLAVMLSGSDTSGNALFGNLQVVAAQQLQLSPVLFAATNSSGGVMGKMISPQNIATGVAVTKLTGAEGCVFARTFVHSIVLTLLLGAWVAIQQFWIPGIIPR